jgi:uncharacterized hydrophobic protein (TIGR00271 family)
VSAANVRATFFVDSLGSWARRIAVLMGLSVVVAVMGVAANSPVVTIGAMLIAPLLEPALGLGAALALREPRQAVRSGAALAVASFGAVGLAWLTTKLLVADPALTAEVLARTTVTRADVVVALAAGATAAWKVGRGGENATFAGAAIAVALVPPLAVVGFTVAVGRPALAAGALALFLVNVAAVVLSAGVVVLVGSRPWRQSTS